MVLQSDCNATVGGLSQQLKNARESKLNIVIPMVFHCKTVAASTATNHCRHPHTQNSSSNSEEISNLPIV